MIETVRLTKRRISTYLSQGKRFDGRAPDAYRGINITFGVSKKAEGSARVKIGNTEVIVGVKIDAVEPFPDSPDEGVLVTTVEMLPLSSPRFESGPPKFEAIELGRLVDRGLRESKFIDFKKLCIKEGEKVWMIFVDMYPLNDDGNLLDAFALGALAALKSARMPLYDEKTGKIQYGEWTNKKLPLTDKVPFTITAYKIGQNLIIDPNKEEEDSAEVNVMLAMSSASQNPVIHALQKNGEKSLNEEEFQRILEFGKGVWKNMYPKIIKYIEP